MGSTGRYGVQGHYSSRIRHYCYIYGLISRKEEFGYPTRELLPGFSHCHTYGGGGGRYSSVYMATRYGLDGPGTEYQLGARFSAPVQTGPGAHPTSYTMDIVPFTGVKRKRRVVDHSHLPAPGLNKV